MTAPAVPMPVVRTSDVRAMPEGMVFKDQYGREYDVEVDVKTKSWVAAPILRDARPPVDLPQNMLEPVVDKKGRVLFGQIYANYPKYRRAVLERRNEWLDTVAFVAKQMYPNNYGEMIANPTRALLLEVGPGPVALELLEAAEAGHPWALGKRREDGSFHPRPKWATQDMLDGVAVLKRSTGFREGVGDSSLTFDAAKYFEDDELDARLDVEEATDPTAVGGKTVKIPQKKKV